MTQKYQPPEHQALFLALRNALLSHYIDIKVSSLHDIVARTLANLPPAESPAPKRRTRIVEMTHDPFPHKVKHQVIRPSFKPSYCVECGQTNVSTDDVCPGMIR